MPVGIEEARRHVAQVLARDLTVAALPADLVAALIEVYDAAASFEALFDDDVVPDGYGRPTMLTARNALRRAISRVNAGVPRKRRTEVMRWWAARIRMHAATDRREFAEEDLLAAAALEEVANSEDHRP